MSSSPERVVFAGDAPSQVRADERELRVGPVSAVAPHAMPDSEHRRDGASNRVVFVNRFFHPDVSATSQMLSDLAFGLAAEGAEVTVVTSRMRYDRPDVRLPARECIDGVDVARVPTTRFGRLKLAGRLMDYASFYASVAWRVGIEGRRGDTLVVKTDPPLLAVALSGIARARGMHLVNWYQDVFPEVAGAAGMHFGPRPVDAAMQRLMRALRDRALRRAAASVVIGERMRDRLANGVDVERRTTLIPNWADTASVAPIEADANALRAEWGLRERFVVAYSGNMGFAHPFGAILDAARRLRHRTDIVFLFVGGGVRRAEIERAVREHGLQDTVVMRPYQPRERLGESLGVGDVHLVSLDPSMEGLVVPSKFYGIGAAGRPTLFVGDPDGELARDVAARHCGTAFGPDDGAGLAEAVLAYAADPDRRRREGDNARAAVEAINSRAGAVRAWQRLLQGLQG